jgi:hypothetical protein
MSKRAHAELGFGGWVFLMASAACGLATACSLGGETIVNESQGADDGDGGAGSSSAQTTGAACAGAKFAKVDLSTLKGCQPGGHCYDKAKTPGALAAYLTPCDDATQVCVPDEVLSAAGDKLQTCTQPANVANVVGPGGGCINLALMPDVQKQAGAYLQQGECPSGLTCMPCKNPQTNSDSGFCGGVGVYDDSSCGAAGADGGAGGGEGAGGDGGAGGVGAGGQACCTTNGKSNGVCMPGSILPADSQGAMPQDTCASSDVCMPAAMVQGKATSCDAGFLFGPGICLDQCFNSMLEVGGSLGVLSSDGCADTEVCTPCSFLQSQMPAGMALPGCQ